MATLRDDMDFAQEIGKRLKAARGRLRPKPSLVELSRRTDGVLSASRIGNYEQGTRLPGPQEALILAKALGVDPAWLLCVEGGELTQEEQQLLADWRALPERDRKAYARRIAALSVLYKDAVPDERMSDSWKAPDSGPQGTPRKTSPKR